MKSSSDDSDVSAVGQAGILVLIGSVFGMFSDFLFRVILSNIVDADIFGAVFLILSLVNIIAIPCLLGMNQGIVKYIPESNTSNRNSYILFSMICSTIACVIISVFILIYPGDIIYTLLNVEERIYLYFLILLLPFYSLYEISLSSLRGLMKTDHHVILKNLAHPILKISILGGAAWIFGTLLPILASLLLVFIISAVIGVFFLLRSRWRPKMSLSINYTSFIYFSLPLMVSSSIYILLKNVDKVLIGSFLNTASVGEYEVAITIATLLGIFQTSFSFLLYPKISDLISQKKSGKIPHLYTQATKWIFLFTLPPYLILVTRPNALVSLFGDQYSISTLSIPLAILATGYFLDAILGPNGQALLGLGRSRAILIYNMIAIFINIPLNIMLIPSHGLIGAALATITGYITMNLLKSADLWMNYRIPSIHTSTAIILISVSPICVLLLNIFPEYGSVVYEIAILSLSSVISIVIGIVSLSAFGCVSASDKKLAQDSLKKLTNIV
ncbi:flippase [Natronococcus occultus]|uniref:Membrane protein involved in the export of O-antigen and teichoic acid n=1 Tax=Natronococcus occultus SP4 TaxID=694430 RepID=L0K3U8_9EURY|nr:flippase [Natronococcus occultus]AGB38773.1 membrane protein involved in the export of O-antigen and teichoic acid [Natronococcus occultus SP4]